MLALLSSFSFSSAFALLCVLSSGPAIVEARRCTYHIDSVGRRRRRCTGLLPGVIAAIIIGALVVLAFLSLAWLLARRRKQAAPASAPLAPYNQAPPPAMMNQALQPTYAPPNFPPPGHNHQTGASGTEYGNGNAYGSGPPYEKNEQYLQNAQMPPPTFNNHM